MPTKKQIPEFKLQYDPAEIPRLAAEYMSGSAVEDALMEAAGKRIRAGEFTLQNLEVICTWKSQRRLDLIKKNDCARIEQALIGAIRATTVESAVCSLTALLGVGTKMASAILTALFPEHYTVLDVRALEALGVRDTSNLDVYVAYLAACRKFAARYGVTLRNFDRANWQWSKRESLKRTCR